MTDNTETGTVIRGQNGAPDVRQHRQRDKKGEFTGPFYYVVHGEEGTYTTVDAALARAKEIGEQIENSVSAKHK